MTIREIAKRANVSPATVSRFMTGSERVSTEKAKRIARVLERLEQAEKPRVRAANRVIGVLVPDMRLQFFADVQWEIIQQAQAHSFQVVFIPVTGNGKLCYLDTIRSMNLKGLILLEEEISPELMQAILQNGSKAVICGGANFNHGHAVTCVHINDLSAGYEGTRYLVGKGHRKIAFLSDNPRSISGGFQRLAGAKKALEEAGIPFEERLWRCGDLTGETGYALTREILSEGIPFTALFAFSDQMALGVINALTDQGLSVPGDVSVLGFDDLPIARTTRPRLTTVHQPLQKIVSSTLAIFEEETIPGDNAEISIPFSIVERESCLDLTENKPGGIER